MIRVFIQFVHDLFDRNSAAFGWKSAVFGAGEFDILFGGDFALKIGEVKDRRFSVTRECLQVAANFCNVRDWLDGGLGDLALVTIELFEDSHGDEAYEQHEEGGANDCISDSGPELLA